MFLYHFMREHFFQGWDAKTDELDRLTDELFQFMLMKFSIFHLIWERTNLSLLACRTCFQDVET
jgi:hypothetical protein